MIKCNLSRMMGEKKLKVADLARQTGLSRATLTLLYNETAVRVDLEAVEKLCRYFNCSIGELFELANDS